MSAAYRALQPFGQDGVVTALEACDERRLQRNALFSCEVRRMTGAAQQPLHLARPVLLLDLDESLEFAQVMGIAQGMQRKRAVNDAATIS